MNSSMIAARSAHSNRKSLLPIGTPAPSLVRAAWSGRTRKNRISRETVCEVCSIIWGLSVVGVVLYYCGKGVWWP